MHYVCAVGRWKAQALNYLGIVKNFPQYAQAKFKTFPICLFKIEKPYILRYKNDSDTLIKQ